MIPSFFQLKPTEQESFNTRKFKHHISSNKFEASNGPQLERSDSYVHKVNKLFLTQMDNSKTKAMKQKAGNNIQKKEQNYKTHLRR